MTGVVTNRLALLLLVTLPALLTACLQTPGVTNASRMLASFNHGGVTQGCSSCHEASRPAALMDASGNLVVHGSGLDCGVCHTPQTPSVPWIKTITLVSHNPTPTQCSTCHIHQRPVGPIGPTPQFNHANGGLGECLLCHTQNAGISWAGGHFSHNPVPTSCSNCHGIQVPAATALYPSGQTSNLFSHFAAGGGAADCVNCHISNTANVGVSWASGSYNHKNSSGTDVGVCLPCHQNERPTSPIGNPSFSHVLSGTMDCGLCHKNPGVNWIGTYFNHNPLPNTCANCHSSEVPAATTSLPAGATTSLFFHSAAYNGTSDCLACHTAVPANVGVSWAGGNFNHLDGAGKSISTCQDCHSNQRPVGPIGSPSFDHANGGTGDCVGCHKFPGDRWSGAGVNHNPLPASCNSCHSSSRPAATTLLPSGSLSPYEHASQFNGLADCVGCHKTNAGTSWSGGNYAHTSNTGGAIGTCLPCHQARGTKQHGSSKGDCVSCHKTSTWHK